MYAQCSRHNCIRHKEDEQTKAAEGFGCKKYKKKEGRKKQKLFLFPFLFLREENTLQANEERGRPSVAVLIEIL